MGEAISQPLVIRADANTQIGTGHVMRCLALAQAWQDGGGHAIFAMAMEAQALEARLKSERMGVIRLLPQAGSVEDALQTADMVQKMGASWIVVDGYYFGADYQHIIKDSGLRLLLIDDNGHADYYYADIVLNQNIYAHESLYPHREPHTRLLLGTCYVLLRQEFLRWRGWKREIPGVARKVLVTLGGGDPENVTLKVIQALRRVAVDGLEAVVLVGGSNPYYGELRSAVRHLPFAIRLERNVTNMPELMAWADVAVSAGGSTCWELAFMGLPNLALILADNQHPITERLGEIGVAVNLGWPQNLSAVEIAKAITKLLIAPGTRAEMARRGRELVDGEGAARVAMCIMGKMLRLRQVREEDCRLLWEWANDPEVRASAFSSDPIPWEEHVQWFMHKLHESSCLLLVALDEQDIPVGQVRLDVKDDGKAEIDVSIDRGKRGLGYGSLLIDMAVEEAFRVTPIQAVHAFIKPHNEGSIRAFEKAKFKRLGTETMRGNAATHYVRGKEQ